MSRIPILAVLFVLLALAAMPAAAQTPSPTPPAMMPTPSGPLPTVVAGSPTAVGTPAGAGPVTPVARSVADPGDVLWTFAQEPPFFDPRVSQGMGILVNAQLQQAAPLRAWYVEVRPSGVVALSPRPVDQALQLLAAGGFRGSDWREAGRCRIWVAPPPVGVTPVVTPQVAGDRLNMALRDALAGIGIQTQLCLPTTNTAEAHLLVWFEGGPPPIVPMRQQVTFLTGPGAAPIAGQPGVVGRGGQAPLPARTGDGGIASAIGIVVGGIAMVAAGAVAAAIERGRGRRDFG